MGVQAERRESEAADRELAESITRLSDRLGMRALSRGSEKQIKAGRSDGHQSLSPSPRPKVQIGGVADASASTPNNGAVRDASAAHQSLARLGSNKIASESGEPQLALDTNASAPRAGAVQALR